MTRIIGDIHGKWDAYKALCQGVDNSIQVGDFGIGFHSVQNTQFMDEWQQENPGHRFIRGNHDKPSLCNQMFGFIKDGSVEGSSMFIGGAFSADQHRRTEGVDWWRDEELSNQELYDLMDVYEKVKPSVMFTHDAPLSVTKEMFIGHYKHQYKTRTGQALQAMFEIHQPDLWMFGHYHETMKYKQDGTEFVCLAELEYMDI